MCSVHRLKNHFLPFQFSLFAINELLNHTGSECKDLFSQKQEIYQHKITFTQLTLTSLDLVIHGNHQLTLLLGYLSLLKQSRLE